MAYIKPSTQVYQDLVNSGGAAAANPDMPACIVGLLTSIIDVDLSSATSMLESIGSTSDSSQADASFTSTPADGGLIYPNFNSAKPGQLLDIDTLKLTAENPLVKTYEYTVTTASLAGAAVTVGTNEIGDVTATPDTVLPFYNTVNHISLGDTVNVLSGATNTSTYVSKIDYVTGTITLNNSTLALSEDDVVSVYHKFSELPVDSFEVPNANGSIPYDVSSPLEAYANVTGYTLHPEFEIEGSGDPLTIYVGYRAKRSDLSGRVLTISDVTELLDVLGDTTSENPLALAVSLALANSGGTAINAIAIDPRISERDAHTQATELAQAQLTHTMVPLTQELTIHATYKAHVNAMSLASSGNWRVALTNCAIPEEDYLYGKPGSADGTDADNYPDLLATGIYNATTFSIDLGRGASAPLVFPGDYIKVYVLDENDLVAENYIQSSAVSENSGSNIVLLNNEWVDAEGTTVTAPTTGSKIYFYAARPSTKNGQADWVTAQAETWSDKRLWMFPGEVSVPNADGLDEVLPGYYLLAALAGFLSGTPAQQPITKITLAGISDLQHGNFYFTEAQLNKMAEKGTLLYVQNAQGTTPYCRHGLTTDVSVLQYREILKVKNIDYLSYYYKNLIDPFIGTWNITPDTIQTIRQNVVSASESLLTRKVAKIGAPLLSYDIVKLEQSTTSSDSIEVVITTATVDPNNYTNVHLQI